MEAWHFVERNIAIKFCHGCKNFHPCGDFGSQGELVRCDKCREYCRGFYQNARNAAREFRDSALTVKQTTSPPAEPESTGSESSATEYNQASKPKEAAGAVAHMPPDNGYAKV
jgi:hypothetical protein